MFHTYENLREQTKEMYQDCIGIMGKPDGNWIKEKYLD
jgi:hypothetical protein